MEAIFDVNPVLEEYRPLYEEALRVAGNAPSPYAAVVALETYFHGGDYVYDQEPLTRGVLPPLVEFVTETRRGYCQHFASAMALMLRYLGVPARVGAGFTSGTYDQESGRWTVTDHDAHTWVEVWFRGFGWLPFDPTPGRGDLDGSYSAASRNFDADVVTAAIAAGAGAASTGFRIGGGILPEGTGATREVPGRDIPGDVGVAFGETEQESLLRLLFLVAVGLVVVIALLKLVLRRSRYLTRDPRRMAAACRRELTEFLADQRVDVNGSATFAELGEVVREQAGIDAARFVSAAQTARYGPLDASTEAARRARRELRRVLRGLRGRLSVWDRARGLVSLRSLGLS